MAEVFCDLFASNNVIPRRDPRKDYLWQTLLSVDDMVENVINILQKKGLINSTYVIFSSDNGYHLGQFSLPNDKRQLYEFDVRVPLMIRGPGIKPGTYSEDIVMNIDLAPTFVNMSGLPVPSQMDGTTILPILHSISSISSRSILIEHQGEHTEFVLGCPQYKNQGMANCESNCVCEDAWNNTYECLVKKDNIEYTKYCKFYDNENFEELYNLTSDPLEMVNTANTIDRQKLQIYREELKQLIECSGKNCDTRNQR